MNTPDVDARHLRAIADRHLPGSGRLHIARMASGVSTPVYRIQRHDVTRYLRLAESPAANLAPEALVHERLFVSGVHVPELIHFDPFHPDLGRSLMITAAIPGCSLAEQNRGVKADAILRAAGQDLARIQQLSVTGFGFVRRDLPDACGIVGVSPTLRAFGMTDLETQLTALTAMFPSGDLDQMRWVVERHAGFLDTKQAVLAHGDLDATHIYHQDGRYTGIIDFGEIRGADRWYDLGHLALHDGEIAPDALLPSVLAGYADMVSLPPDRELRIQFWRLLIGVRTLARSIHRPPAPYQVHVRQSIQTALQSMSWP